MVMALKLGLTVRVILENGEMDKHKVKGLSTMLMEMFLMEGFLRIKLMARACILTSQDNVMKEIGSMICNMVSAKKF